MLSLNIKIFGVQSVAARLRQFPEETQAAAHKAMGKSLSLVEARTKEKLSSDVLGVRSGRLRSSIGNPNAQGIKKISQSGGLILGELGTRVKYARIHELGGTIHVPEIFPRSKKALRFEVGGKTVFAKRVKAHDVVMPARPYLGPALDESRDKIHNIFGTEIQVLIQRLAAQGGTT